tara:strand:- start:916 stop:1542 length:627 start_codon:yes stop_codon:yes gene_type:complete
MSFFSKLFFLLFCTCSFVLAQDYKLVKNPNQLIAKFKQSSQSIQSIEATFVESKEIKVLKNKQQTSGVFYYKKDDKMRWEQVQPSSYIILIDGDAIKIKDGASKKDMAGSRMATQIKSLLMGLVNGNFNEDNAFSKQYFENEQYYQVSLTPVNRRLKNIYSNISLTFDKKSLNLTQLNFEEKGGDSSAMKFSKHKINLPIKDALFRSF